jgi:LysM repeat protein
MKKRASFAARIFAALALVAAVLAIVLVVSSGVKDDNPHRKGGSANTTKHEPTHHRIKAKTYTVQTGDTLTSIAQKTGVRVSEIQALNPEVDPLTLVAGETLKLR